MKCPIDGSNLVMADRSGVEIDYCPQCRGVWLDRGELDKIIERSAVPATPAQDGYAGSRDHDSRRDYGERPRKKRMSSFIEDIFDF